MLGLDSVDKLTFPLGGGLVLVGFTFATAFEDATLRASLSFLLAGDCGDFGTAGGAFGGVTGAFAPAFGGVFGTAAPFSGLCSAGLFRAGALSET